MRTAGGTNTTTRPRDEVNILLSIYQFLTSTPCQHLLYHKGYATYTDNTSVHVYSLELSLRDPIMWARSTDYYSHLSN